MNFSELYSSTTLKLFSLKPAFHSKGLRLTSVPTMTRYTSLTGYCWSLVINNINPSTMAHLIGRSNWKRLQSVATFSPRNNTPILQYFHTLHTYPCASSTLFSSLIGKSYCYKLNEFSLNRNNVRWMSNTSVSLKVDNDVVRFCVDKTPDDKGGERTYGKKTFKKAKKSKKAKVNELKLYRLKAKKKMTSPNPEVRIRYKLEKAKRKETWLIEKLRKFELPKPPKETYDPEILTEEEKFYLKRTGEKKKNYVPVGRRGVFGGVVLNMHLHWKKHETVKVICKRCKPGQIHEYAEELTRLSKGIVIDIKSNNTIIFYRGKNYVQPKVMSPTDTLSKNKALEKYTYEQSLEHTSQFIEKLENELEEYYKHIERYKKNKEAAVK